MGLNLDYDAWITYGLGLVVLYMLIRVFLVPIRFLLQTAYHLVLGGAILWAVNWVGQYFGYHLALNPLTAFAVGYLGAPGLVLLVLLQQMVLS